MILAWTIYLWLSDPLYGIGVGNANSIIFLGGIYALAALVYVAARRRIAGRRVWTSTRSIRRSRPSRSSFRFWPASVALPLVRTGSQQKPVRGGRRARLEPPPAMC